MVCAVFSQIVIAWQLLVRLSADAGKSHGGERREARVCVLGIHLLANFQPCVLRKYGLDFQQLVGRLQSLGCAVILFLYVCRKVPPFIMFLSVVLRS